MLFFNLFHFQGGTVLGQPARVEKIGETFIPYQVFKDYLRGLADSKYRQVQFHHQNTFEPLN